MWTFAQAVYSGPGIAPALIQWQDDTSADICLLLALLFAERRGLSIDAGTVSMLDALTADWRNTVIAPLRKIRRQLKTAGSSDITVEAIRTTIKSAELAAERQQLAMLANALTWLESKNGSELSCLRLYADHLGVMAPPMPELANWVATQP